LSASALFNDDGHPGNPGIALSSWASFGQSALPGGCNAWQFSGATTGPVSATLLTKTTGLEVFYNGITGYSGIDATVSLWVNVQALSGTSQIGLGLTISPSGGAGTLLAQGDGSMPT